MKTALSKEDQKGIEHLLEKRAGVLTTWEIDFLKSIHGRAALTDRQRARFEKIWADVVMHRRWD